MCGIIGYTGSENSVPYLINGLEKLEYRGYDSAGIAVTDNNSIFCIKTKGRVEILKEKLKNENSNIFSKTGIAHTRWATHGEASDINSHPHLSEHGFFAVVHNGIIENYAGIKEELINDGVEFMSETDTEIIPQLIEKYYDGDFLSAVKKASDRLKGSYAIAVLCRDFPDKIICARKSSPIIVALYDTGTFASSDISAIPAHAKNIYRVADGEFALLEKEKISFFDRFLNPVKKEPERINNNITFSGKQGYEHFMLKEIFEQPAVIRDTVLSENINLSKEYIDSIKQIYIVACGSAYHVGVLGKYVIEKLTKIPVQTDIASEFRYREPAIDKSTLVIAISQSGETADTIAAVRLSRETGAKVISVVNVAASTLTAESDEVIYTKAGTEIAVATTKAYSAQLISIYKLAVYIAEKTGRMETEEKKSIISSLNILPALIETILSDVSYIEKLADVLKNSEHIYFIGRNIDYAAALEASLKMKEISYIHSEAYGAGEMKHGTISLIEKDTPVIALCCCENVFQKTLSNIKEVKSRGATVLCVTTQKHNDEIDDADYKIIIPDTHPLFIGSTEIIPLQLLAYFTAKKRGCDIDKPKNLAKSVTVE